MPELLAIEATLLTATFLVPQIVRIISREDTAGLSAVGPDSGWSPTWRGLHMSGSRISGSPPSPRLWRSWHTRSGPHRAPCAGIEWWRPSFWYSASLLAAEALMGPAGLGLLLAMTPAVQLMPGVIAVYGTLLWGGYGWLVADLPLIGYGVVTVIGSALILARCWATRPGVRFVRALVEV